MSAAEAPPFSLMPDLAGARLGGRAVACNDEFFAPKERLLRPEPAVFVPDEYTERGKWMDGWESRRRRQPGHDWCVVRLGAPGTIHGVIVDTSHFRGNHPESCSIEGCHSASELPGDDTDWVEIVARSTLRGHHANGFEVPGVGPCSHVRLNIFPDGGVARLRVHGLADAAIEASGDEPVDLVAALAGGSVVACNDMFFSAPQNLILPGDSAGMHDGWETRRRRGPGHDWCVLRLGAPGIIERIVVDTSHFKGNYPDRCSIDIATAARDGSPLAPIPAEAWIPLLPERKLEADRTHEFECDATSPATHVRLNIHPDGGVARLRVLGRPTGR